MPKFSAGGAEKSLLMLLYLLSDYKDLQIDLMLFKKEGIFLEQLPKNVNVIDTEESLKAAYSKFSSKHLLISLIRPFATAICTILTKNQNQRNQMRWKYFYKHLIKELPNEYDYACGYLDGEATYYVVDKVKSKVKYAWNQNDYQNIKANPKIDDIYYKKVDLVITLTEECTNIFIKNFPSAKNRIEIIPPYVSSSFIKSRADEYIPAEYNEEDYKMVSVGRLVEQKGFDIAIKSASLLKQAGYKFKWYIIGNGELYDELKNQINSLELNDYVILLGIKSNPYPYIKHANLFVQPSRFEGKSVILNETKYLEKVIVVTKYPTVSDQITNGFDGIVVDINENAISSMLGQIMSKTIDTSSVVNNLKGYEDPETESVKKKYLKLFDL